MPLLSSVGTNSVDLAIDGTYRQDQSELLLSALYLDPSFLGSLQGGEGFSGNARVKIWNEESLNPSTVTLLNAGGINGAAVSITVSNADAVVLENGTVLGDTGISGGLSASERMQITGIGPANSGGAGNTLVAIVRAVQGGPVATGHAQNAVLAVLSQSLPMNSDLGADRTRPRIPHYNYLEYEDINVNLGREAIDSSLLGYTPGVPNEFTKQILNRLKEKFITLNRTFEYSLGDPGNGTPGSVAGDNATAWGLVPMLGGGGSLYNSTSTVYDYSAHYGPGQIFQAVNDVNETLFENGVRPDYLYCPAPAARSISSTFKDMIRLVQDETTRGFFVKRIQTDLGNELDIIVDPYLSSTNGSIDMLVVDSGRIRICPWQGSFMEYITSPSFRDGDAARCVIRMTMEARNTGSDSGQAHYYMEKVSV